MNPLSRALASAALCLLAPAALAADPATACANERQAPGIQGRIHNLRTYMERIERASDPLEQRRLMAIHMKVMGEGMRELRKDETSDACRVAMLHVMMEQMLRHHLAEQEARER
jgi:hypothetical protein